MSKENIKTVKKLFEAVEKRDLASVLRTYDENIVIREAASLPYGGEYHGIEGAQKHAYAYVQAWKNFQSEDEQKLDAEFLDAGDYVVVKWRQRAKNGAREINSLSASIYKLRDGKVIESEMFQDTAAISRFLEVKENID